MSKGGTEAIVESVYSTMKSQKQPGGQKNSTLVDRTKVKRNRIAQRYSL